VAEPCAEAEGCAVAEAASAAWCHHVEVVAAAGLRWRGAPVGAWTALQGIQHR
jgi:hypothetical protein